MKARKYPLVLFMTVVFLSWSGCEGPEGPSGQGLEDIDLEPPEITLLEPSAGDTITTALAAFSADVSDNDSVKYV